MKERQTKIQTALMLAVLVAGSLLAANPAHAESLFHASADYQAQEPLAPRSIYAPPISHNVGDLVTILVNETSTSKSEASLDVSRSQTYSGQSGGVWNNLLGWAGQKVPFATKITDKLTAPSITNAANSGNNWASEGTTERKTVFTDSIACQVVQVLPNGDLMVQGQKTVMVNKERQDLMITGIVRPYYLDRYNQIKSNQVANMQLLQGGKGVLSRQQNDGIANKIYQFFN